MALEIEHKYLIKLDLWGEVTPEKKYEIKQGYIITDPNKVVRVRTKGDQGFITIKGKTTGASKLEFEYEIPIDDAYQLLRLFCSDVIEKTRHIVTFENKLWEVDEFHGLNGGLFLAEIELKSETEDYKLPPWIDKNVTADSRFANSNLAKKPYSTW